MRKKRVHLSKARTFIFFLLLITALAPACLKAQDIRRVKIEDLESYISTSDHPLLISFWATWCAPCVHEIPWLRAALDQYPSYQPELVLVSLDFPESYPAKLQSFIRKQGLAGSFFWMDETDADHFCPRIDAKWTGGIPANLFVNPATGYRKFIGRQLTDRQARQEVERMLGLQQ